MTRSWKIRTRVCPLAILSLAGLCLITRIQAQDATAKPISANSAEPAANAARPMSHEYELAPGDVVQIRFFYNPELNEKVQIRPDGRITLALIGELELRNKTTAQATNQLENAYKNYLKTPSVTVQVEEFGSQKIFVGGEIMHPGMLPLVGKLSVLDALISAGGFKPTATSNSVLLLRRKVDGTAEAMQKVSLRSIDNQAPEAAQIFLRSFDVILVPEKRISKIDRWVDQYLRQTVPVQMNAGFNYLFDGAVVR
jgi:polysaccharide export outer membrane protein